jgi:hypothetical protein
MSVAPISLFNRLLLVSFALSSLLLAAPQARAEDKVLRVGKLKLIHGITPYFYEKFAPPICAMIILRPFAEWHCRSSTCSPMLVGSNPIPGSPAN